MEVLSSRQLEPRIENQESIMYRCTSDASLETSSALNIDSKIGENGCFQKTNQSETTSKVPPKKVTPESSTETASVVIVEPLSESEHLGLGGKIRHILESFNLEDFWHALVLGKKKSKNVNKWRIKLATRFPANGLGRGHGFSVWTKSGNPYKVSNCLTLYSSSSVFLRRHKVKRSQRDCATCSSASPPYS